MASYMNSNEPYQRVTPDGIVDGMAIGATSAAAAAGLVHASSSIGSRRSLRRFRNQTRQSQRSLDSTLNQITANDMDPSMKVMSAQVAANTNRGTQARLRDEHRNNKSVNRHSRSFGSGWRKALTYGASAAVGGAIGVSTDAMIDG